MTVDEARQFVRDEAEPFGLEQECLSAFDGYIANGDNPDTASWCALYDWDI